MEIILLQFSLTALNLYGAKAAKDRGRNPAFNYFVAGMTFGFGFLRLLELLIK
jgi:hypothetical protein